MDLIGLLRLLITTESAFLEREKIVSLISRRIERGGHLLSKRSESTRELMCMM